MATEKTIRGRAIAYVKLKKAHKKLQKDYARVCALLEDSAMRVYTLECERDAAKAELHETYTDDTGQVWTRPTAWAYYAACRALHAKRAIIDAVVTLVMPQPIAIPLPDEVKQGDPNGDQHQSEGSER